MANFSPVNRAEISARLLKQILLKSNCRLHGDFFSPGAELRPGLKKSHVIEKKLQPGLKSRNNMAA